MKKLAVGLAVILGVAIALPSLAQAQELEDLIFLAGEVDSVSVDPDDAALQVHQELASADRPAVIRIMFGRLTRPDHSVDSNVPDRLLDNPEHKEERQYDHSPAKK